MFPLRLPRMEWGISRARLKEAYLYHLHLWFAARCKLVEGCGFNTVYWIGIWLNPQSFYYFSSKLVPDSLRHSEGLVFSTCTTYMHERCKLNGNRFLVIEVIVVEEWFTSADLTAWLLENDSSLNSWVFLKKWGRSSTGRGQIRCNQENHECLHKLKICLELIFHD